MKTLHFLLQSSRRDALGAGLLAAAGGLCGAALIALMHRALGDRDRLALYALGFGAVLAVKLGADYWAQLRLTRYAHETSATLRRRIVDGLVSLPFERFEQLPPGRVTGALVDDVNALNVGLLAVPGLGTQAAVLAAGSLYLLHLSWPIALMLAAVGAVGFGLYRGLARRSREPTALARRGHDTLYGHFEALAHGMKELQLHRPRREAFTGRQIDETTRGILRHQLRAARLHLRAQLSNRGFFLLAIGLTLFAAPWAGAGQEAIAGYLVGCLYLMGPLGAVLQAIPVLSRADVALERLEDIGMRLREPEPQPDSPRAAHFERIELRDARFEYAGRPGEPGFGLGPVDLALSKGQIVCVTGPNGSGKTTLGKLLTGLYAPSGGRVLWDGAVVDGAMRDDYRQLFAATFSPAFVFERLYGLGEHLDARANELAGRFGLNDQVRVAGGAFSTTSLSTGQRKRLALLTTYLENRPAYVFDEWAAEQDPVFREIFYRRLLPELRALGKLVVLITHDERFFDIADRVVRLDRGEVVDTGEHVPKISLGTTA